MTEETASQGTDQTEQPISAPRPALRTFAFVFIDLTTDTTPANLKPGPWLTKIEQALAKEINGPWAASHGTSANFRTGSGPDDRTPSEIAIHLRDTIPEAPGALAYHAVTNGVPDIEIGCDLFDTVVDGSNGQEAMSSGIDHEIKELMLDAGANQWADLQDGSGMMRAHEACDTVQNTGHAGEHGVWLSNFLLASAFIPGAPAPWDYQGVMQSQDDYSNGYEIQAGSPQDISQVSGNGIHEIKGLHAVGRRCTFARIGDMSEKTRKRKAHRWSRTYRRGVRL
jgi:hypothetical protein